MPPLHSAVDQSDHWECVELLLAYGADPNQRDYDVRHPYRSLTPSLARRNHFPNPDRRLASPPPSKRHPSLPGQGRSPLLLAADCGAVRSLILLLEKGAQTEVVRSHVRASSKGIVSDLSLVCLIPLACTDTFSLQFVPILHHALTGPVRAPAAGAGHIQSALVDACCSCNRGQPKVDCIRELLAWGADVNADAGWVSPYRTAQSYDGRRLLPVMQVVASHTYGHMPPLVLWSSGAAWPCLTFLPLQEKGSTALHILAFDNNFEQDFDGYDGQEIRSERNPIACEAIRLLADKGARMEPLDKVQEKGARHLAARGFPAPARVAAPRGHPLPPGALVFPETTVVLAPLLLLTVSGWRCTTGARPSLAPSVTARTTSAARFSLSVR